MARSDEEEIDEEPRKPPEYIIESASTVLNFDRFETKTFWSYNSAVHEPSFCRMIMPSFKYFKVAGVYDLRAIVDMLINSQPSLEALEFSRAGFRYHDQEITLDTQCMVRLLNEYATTSLSESNTKKHLRNVMLEYYDFISDDVLDVLANIGTIQGLSFGYHSNITPQSFKNFFVKLKKQNFQINPIKV